MRTGPGQRQNLHTGVIVIKDFPLGRLPDQLLESGSDHFRRFLHDLPLRRGGQWNPHTRLQPCQPIKRNATAVLQQPDHRRRTFVVLLLPHALRRFRLINLAAQVAAQTLQFIDGGRQWRLAHHPNPKSRLLPHVNFPFQTFRTVVTGLQRSVRDFDPPRAPIGLGAVPAVPRFRLLIPVRARRWTAWRRDLDPCLLQNLARLLRARFRQERAQPADRRVLVPDQVGQITERLQDALELLIPLFVQGLLARPLQQRCQLFQVHFDLPLRRLHLLDLRQPLAKARRERIAQHFFNRSVRPIRLMVGRDTSSNLFNGATRSFAEVRQDIEKKLITEEAHAKQERWLASLRQKAYIKMY